MCEYHLPLSEIEIDNIKMGEIVTKHWHEGEKARIAIVHDGHLTNEEIESRTKEIVESGDDVINVPLDEKSLKHLTEGVYKIGYADGIELYVLREKFYNEAVSQG